MGQWISGVRVTDGYLSGKTLNTNLGSLDDMTFTTAPDKTATSLKLIQGNRVLWQGTGLISLLGSMESGDSILLAGIDVKVSESSPYEKCQMRYTLTKVGTQTLSLSLALRCYTDSTTYTDATISTPQTLDGTIYPLTDEFYFFFAFTEYDGESFVCTGLSDSYGNGGDLRTNAWAMNYFNFVLLINGIVDSEEYSPEFGPASEPDGYGQGDVTGTHDKHSDHVGIPTKPQYGFTSAGFLNHYRISAQGLSMLGEALFPEPQGPSLDILGAIDRLTANMWNSKIIDYIIDCRIIPVIAPATNQVNITCGGKVLVHPGTGAAYSAYLVDEDFVDVDCGTITTGLTEGNFIDFSVTRAKIFIPFYGYVDLAPEYWHGAKIGLYYRFNLMDGSFMAWLTSSPFRAELESAGDMEIIGQYAGNACIHLPINSQSYSQIIGGMITTGAAIVGAAAGGAIGGAASHTIVAGAVQTAISGAANIANGRPQLINNNSYNGSAALMSNRTPYLLIEFGEAQFSTKYTDECGLPLVVNKRIGDCSGMTVCDNAIINFACTDAEAKEILAALREGVIV